MREGQGVLEGLQLWDSCQLLPGLELLEPLESPHSPCTPRSLAPRQPGKGFCFLPGWARGVSMEPTQKLPVG